MSLPEYELWHGDCLTEMDRIADNSVDMILADLPYGSTGNVWDSPIPLESLWKGYKRLLKKQGAVILTSRQPFTSLLVISNFDWFKYEWIWKKSHATGQLNLNIQPMTEHENILVFGQGRIIYNLHLTKKPEDKVRAPTRMGLSPCYGSQREYDRTIPIEMRAPTSVLEVNSVNHGERGLHPTQKPVALLRYLIRTYSNEGDTILDNTCGSGSTLEAAMRENRHSIGIELYPLPDRPIGDDNPDYFGIASRRLANVARELRGEWKPLRDNGHTLEDLPLFQTQPPTPPG